MAFIHTDASYQTNTLYTYMTARVDNASPFDLPIAWTSEAADANFQLNLLSPWPVRTQVPDGIRLIGFVTNVPAGVIVHVPAFYMNWHSAGSTLFDVFVTNTTGSDQLCSTNLICELV
jgi:hypothetical protein